MPSLLLLAPLLALSMQTPPLDAVRDRLAERTAARIKAASEAFDHGFAAYCADAQSIAAQTLLTFSPELQVPVFKALTSWLDLPEDERTFEEGEALIQLLAATMNTHGAARLLATVDLLPVLLRPPALAAGIEQGTTSSRYRAERWLAADSDPVRRAALLGLCEHGSILRLPIYLEELASPQTPAATASKALETLSQRALPRDFPLPTVLLEGDPALLPGLFALLSARPQTEARDMLLETAADLTVSPALRLSALALLEEGAGLFGWSGLNRVLESALREATPSPYADELAWALHRLGSRRGTDHLLAGVRGRVEGRSDDWRARLDLAERLLELQDHSDSYREFRRAFSIREKDRRARGRINPRLYLLAARAAAGSRHLQDCIEWLELTRWSPAELAPHADEPEFAPYLERTRLRQLFGLK